ncbi:translocation and assembly module lipoprotein TamL [Rufibacter psychrotolerans]|uniref:translocation and assembly module lipoprotein TamL n=1 Tax=Rufibacter psychrotolerans TaxID=2812556 RepID=UPI001967C0A3|nr:BamA/TamA family outer membrane protein [Rufibacter sp. SYSU D00308]
MKLRCYVFGAVFTMLCLLLGCTPTRHLSENERLLWRIKLEGVKQNNKSEIAALYQQKPNRRVLGVPLYLNLYYLGKRFYNPERIQANIEEETADANRRIQRAGADSVRVDKLIEKKETKLAKLQNKKENGNWLMRTVGEPPAIFDSLKLVQTEDQVRIFLNSKGFFRNHVSSTTQTHHKKVFVTLQVEEDKPYLLTQHTYQVADTTILNLLQANQATSFIKLQQNYDEGLLSQERTRLEQLLKNNGFYEFRQQFITFEADTSYEDYTVRLSTLIANPTDTTRHKVYTIKDVYFISDAGLNRFGRTRDTVALNNVHFLAYQHRIKPKILARKVIIRPGQTYSASRTLNNQRIVSNLDVFKYTTISYTKVADSVRVADTVAIGPNQGLLNAQINTALLPRFQETSEVGGTFTEKVPGPYTSIRFRIRNIFGGAEIFDVGVRAGVEGQLQRNVATVGRRTEIGADMGVTFPQILVPFRTNDLLIRYNPRTRFSTGYTYVDRNEYTRTNVDFSFDYIWQRLNIHQFSFSPLDINVISSPRIDPQFQQYLDTLELSGNPLNESFKDAFVSSINFTSLYNTANYNQSNDAKLVRLFVETGGLLWNYLAEQFKDMNTYRFAKLNVDYRRYHALGNNMTFVYRANGGVAKPLGKSRALPYDKYFFAGGSSSVRAWLPRRLGPGSSSLINRDPNSENFNQVDYLFEQPGEILLELNSEFRFRIFRFGGTNVNGALFVDAGNVWLFQERNTNPNPNIYEFRPGAKFELNRFYKELAVGTGFGVRLDFTFAILRFDVATKLYDPAMPQGNRFVINQFRSDRIFGNTNQTTFNLGIGYPF